MVRTIRVKAVGGLVLSHPTAGALRAEGSLWPADQFTMRRIAEKSVEVIEDKPQPKSAPKSSEAKQ